jgi:hypothetical protein
MVRFELNVFSPVIVKLVPMNQSLGSFYTIGHTWVWTINIRVNWLKYLLSLLDLFHHSLLDQSLLRFGIECFFLALKPSNVQSPFKLVGLAFFAHKLIFGWSVLLLGLIHANVIHYSVVLLSFEIPTKCWVVSSHQKLHKVLFNAFVFYR